MPNKNNKKAKPAKPAKPAPKLAKGVKGAAAPKKAAKPLPKKAPAAPVAAAKKKLEAPKKHDKHEKHAAPHKADKKHAAPAPAAKDAGKRKIVAAPAAAKDSKKPNLKVVPPAPEAPNGKKKSEVVVEVPAPKGVAILRNGKAPKKGKAEASPASLGKKRCREPGCDHEMLVSGYCRLHYIKNWRKIKRKEAILASGQLNNYVEELVNKYPDKYLDVIRQDLASEKEWAKVVIDLELESADEEGGGEDDIDAVAEGVRTDRGGFEDDSDSF